MLLVKKNSWSVLFNITERNLSGCTVNVIPSHGLPVRVNVSSTREAWMLICNLLRQTLDQISRELAKGTPPALLNSDDVIHNKRDT